MHLLAGRPCRMAAVHARQSQPKKLFVFGLGYTGTAVSHQLQKAGWSVSGTCRPGQLDKQQHLKARGVTVHDFDPDNLQCLSNAGIEQLQEATCILTTVPPKGDFDQDPVLQCHQELLASLPHLAWGGPAWVGYLSSTGVYGDHKGAEVTEESELLATDSTGSARRAAETRWLSLHTQHGLPVHIFRLGGIYGPNRSALDAVKRKGPPSASQLRRSKRPFTARIHVHDICRALSVSIDRPSAGSVYNLVDNDPAGREFAVQWALQLLGNGQPQAGNNTMEEVRAVPSGKRVSNRKMLSELCSLEFASYREGLDAIFAGDMRPFDV